MNPPLVAIIGLPNSGKSTFFNKVLAQRKALTHSEAGTTRDRAYGLVNWNSYNFILIDTAGLAPATSDLEKNIQKQTQIAINEADLILLMVDAKSNPGQSDFAVAKALQRSKKPIVLAVNKVDVRNPKTDVQVVVYEKLGLGNPFPVSSVNGSGIGDLLDSVVKILKQKFPPETADEKSRIKLTFIGKPNVGKSSLVNALLKQERLVVDAKAGTTRSTIEIPFEYDGKNYLLLDTAGIKRKWKETVEVEVVAALQALRTLSITDIALFVVDAAQPMTTQDQAIADEIIENHIGVIIVLNKIDLVSEEKRSQILDSLPDYFSKLWWAPVVFSSAKTSEGLPVMLELAYQTFIKSSGETQQEDLDKFLDNFLKDHTPGKMEDQREPKIYNLKQIGVKPPTFKLTVNLPAAFAEAWKRLFEKQFRLKFGFEGNPIKMAYSKRL